MVKQKRILVNAIVTPDGTKISSRHRHEYVTYKDSNGFSYSVDGGTCYLRRVWDNNAPAFKEISIHEGDPHAAIRELLEWGSLGKEGDGEFFEFIAIKDLEMDHIKAILGDNPEGILYVQSSSPVHKVLLDEIEWRIYNTYE